MTSVTETDPASGAPSGGAENSGGSTIRILTSEAEIVRAALGSKRSDKLLRLFEYLLARTIEGQSPSEMDIADEVFSSGRTLDVSQDATVRVYIHRLRKTLDQIYADRPPPRLQIPKGEYRIVVNDDQPISPDAPEAEPDSPAPRSYRPRALIWAALALLVMANLAAWWLIRPFAPEGTMQTVAGTRLWRSIAHDSRPIVIVLGDYYTFADSSGSPNAPAAAPRFILDPAINSRQDLDIFLMRAPGEVGRYTDRDLRFVPSSTVFALGGLFETVRSLRGGSGGARASVLPVAQLTPEILKSSDVIYVGLLSGLGPLLRNPVFQASGFKVGKTYDELIDRATNRHYMSDGVVMSDEHIPRRDFGYIASIPGPSGNRIVVIAGTRDSGLLQMAEVASDPAKLRELNLPAPISLTGFEALYQVRTMGNLNLSGRLLIERPVRWHGIWDTTKASQRFPGDEYEGAGNAQH